jgi:hypothetical protein
MVNDHDNTALSPTSLISDYGIAAIQNMVDDRNNVGNAILCRDLCAQRRRLPANRWVGYDRVDRVGKAVGGKPMAWNWFRASTQFNRVEAIWLRLKDYIAANRLYTRCPFSWIPLPCSSASCRPNSPCNGLPLDFDNSTYLDSHTHFMTRRRLSWIEWRMICTLW